MGQGADYDEIFVNFLNNCKDNLVKFTETIEKGKIKFVLENPAIRIVLESKLKNVVSNTLDYHLNKEIVEIEINDFLNMILKELEELESKKKIKKLSEKEQELFEKLSRVKETLTEKENKINKKANIDTTIKITNAISSFFGFVTNLGEKLNFLYNNFNKRTKMTSNIKEAFSQNKIWAGTLASVMGFIADVCQPLAPFSKYLFFISIAIFFISALSYLAIKNLRTKILPVIVFTVISSFVFGLMFGLQSASKDGDERVLIPRFETEILVKKVLNIASNFKNPKICEIGTGSGIISICLRKNLRGAKIIATDISQNAIEVAKINAKKHGAKIEFKHTSLMDGVEGEFDIIVSNPPYIANSYELDARVLNEPKIALFGGEVGNEILEKIVQIAKTRAKFLACEMGYDQKESMEKILQNANFHAIFYKDLAGFDRGFSAKNRNLV